MIKQLTPEEFHLPILNDHFNNQELEKITPFITGMYIQRDREQTAEQVEL